ncbi:hypothetical protein [Modestobacter roseus]|uniref:hypothetical protein n=1 Tax=Modestobacter roseus TaxID=1181884 RepID=UPI0034DFD354
MLPLPVLGIVGWKHSPFLRVSAADVCHRTREDDRTWLTTPAEGLFSQPFSTPCPGARNAVPWFVNPGIWLCVTLMVVGALLWLVLGLREWVRDPGWAPPPSGGRTTADRGAVRRGPGSDGIGLPAADDIEDETDRSLPRVSSPPAHGSAD